MFTGCFSSKYTAMLKGINAFLYVVLVQPLVRCTILEKLELTEVIVVTAVTGVLQLRGVRDTTYTLNCSNNATSTECGENSDSFGNK